VFYKIKRAKGNDDYLKSLEMSQSNTEFAGRLKKGKPNIAPLQPPTLATFRSWGSSAGAGRAGLPGAKITFPVSNLQANHKINPSLEVTRVVEKIECSLWPRFVDLEI
jgi:hypothetical protein